MQTTVWYSADPVLYKIVILYNRDRRAVIRIRLFRFPRVGGWGINLYWRGRRVFAVERHRFRLRGREVVRLRYHRRPGMDKHRPWERGW